MNPWLMLIVVFLVGSGLAVGQDNDPLLGLVGGGEERLDKGEMQLKVVVLRMAKVDAARLLVEDDGKAESWETRLVKLKEAGKVMRLEAWEDDSYSTQGVWEGGWNTKHRYLSQGTAAVLWDDWKSYEVTKESRLNLAAFFDELREKEVGGKMRVEYEVVPNSPWVELQANIFSSSWEDRHSKNWVVPEVSTPKVIFFPWEMNVGGRVKRNEVFLIGTQMDPWSGDEEGSDVIGAKYENAVLAFGKIVSAKIPEEAGETNLRVQTWTLAVETGKFADWIRRRNGRVGDGEALSKWLGEDEVLAVSSILTRPGGRMVVRSEQSWEDSIGFEPSSNPIEYRPKPCEEDLFALRHEMEVELSREPGKGGDGGGGNDPFEVVEKKSSVAAADSWGNGVQLSLRVQRPSAPARWLRWKTAMDRADDDPNAIEVTEGDSGGSGESFSGGLNSQVGEVVMVNAGLKQGKVHVTFVRAIHDGVKGKGTDRVIAAKGANSRGVTYWELETPLSWATKWEGTDAVDAKGVATELLDGIGKGEVVLKQLTGYEAASGERLAQTMGKPVMFFGGNYVNTALSLQGVFFNTRMVGSELVGARSEIGYSSPGEDWWKGHLLSIASTARDEPAWRQWGLWIEEMEKTNAENCGLPQPIFPIHQLDINAELAPGIPVVMAMARVSQSGSNEIKKGRLRWWVGLVNGEPEMRGDRRVKGEDIEKADKKGLLQALVLEGPIENEDGQLWMRMLAEGKCKVLDAATRMAGEDGGGSIATGVEYYFPNGRQLANGEMENAMVAKREMAAGTEFSYQVSLSNRLVGVKFHSGRWRGRWELEREFRAPEVVTDVFQAVRTEFPMNHQTMKREDMPKVTVNVQRPIFEMQKAEGFVPKPGEMVVQRLSASTVVVVRWLDMKS